MSKRLLVGVFESEDDTLAAIRASRQRGFKVVDVYAPYAVHGVEEAMGLSPSRLP
jgi:pyruvate/2-oxoacid:ferredoxin oxidoreductase beta subunit